ncbi:MAG: hypothetical protein ACRERC_12815, partial [Candidatus Binatia bacterium]
RPPAALLATLLFALVLSGCVTVDYIGKSFPPTANVELFMSPVDVKQPYEVIGEARAEVGALPFSNPGKELQDKLLEEARARGADAIILGVLDTRNMGQASQTTGQSTTKYKGNKKSTQYTETTTSPDEVTELRGTLIRYTR